MCYVLVRPLQINQPRACDASHCMCFPSLLLVCSPHYMPISHIHISCDVNSYHAINARRMMLMVKYEDVNNKFNNKYSYEIYNNLHPVYKLLALFYVMYCN